MSEIDEVRRATVHDVAREAGVSLATVDRVLNGRPGVRPVTAEKVAAAIRQLDFRRDLSASLLARARDLRIAFLLPDGGNAFMESLSRSVARRARTSLSERVGLEVMHYHAFDGPALARQLDGLEASEWDSAVLVALDHDSVRAAVDAATRRGIAVVTLVSDLPGSARQRFVGIDNLAAGRTAASLLGRFCAPGGRIGIVAGSLGLRDHRDRFEGFRQVIDSEFGLLKLAGPVEGRDDDDATRTAVGGLLASHPDLAGLYNIGAGNAGLMAALADAGAAGRVRTIVHELNEPTRAGLRSGTIDLVIDQNPDGEIRAAISAARTLALAGEHGGGDASPIEIRLFLRDNLVEGHHRSASR